MAHKTLVGGTTYEVKSGRCLVDGTAYSIQKGRTLVDGTGYDVNFGPSIIPVIINGNGNTSYAYAEINGTKHTKAASGIEVSPGDVISLTVGKSISSGSAAYLEIDGERVVSVGSKGKQTYNWSVPMCNSVSIVLAYSSSTMQTTSIIVTTA
jgi:hypothetical protein